MVYKKIRSMAEKADRGTGRKSQFRLIGTSMPRVDVTDKVNGSAIFGIDVFIPDMLYAVVACPPAYGATAISYDKEAAERVTGVRNVVDINRGISVCADTLDTAWKGRDALAVKWDRDKHLDMNNETLERIFIRHLDKNGIAARTVGNGKLAMSNAVKKIGAIYLLP